MVTSVTKSLGIIENLFLLRLAPRPKNSKSEKLGALLLINLLILHGGEIGIGRSSGD